MEQVLNDRIREAVSHLMVMNDGAGAVRVSVPVLYPSGAASSVEVNIGRDECFVSDMGTGHTEAYLANAADFFGHHAKRTADRFGIGFDGQSLFVARAPVDRIEGAIVTVANASVQAASLSILAAEEDRDRRRNDEVYDRVRSIFGAAAVTKVVELEGKHASWSAHNVVSLRHGRKAVFEFVTSHPNSISSKYMMFSDVVMRDGHPSLNAVVRSLEALGPRGALLPDVCNVLPLTASNDDFVRYAEAA